MSSFQMTRNALNWVSTGIENDLIGARIPTFSPLRPLRLQEC